MAEYRRQKILLAEQTGGSGSTWVLLEGLLLMEGKDGIECHEYSNSCSACHLSIKGTIHPQSAVLP